MALLTGGGSAGVRRRICALVVMLGAAGAVARPSAAQVRATEYQLKAVFLYNFAQFVDWPERAFSDARTPFVIGVLGDDPFGPFLDATVEEQRVAGRPLVVRRLRHLEDARDCHIVFVSRSETARLDDVRTALGGRPILLVSDIDGFAEQGGMIGFVMDQNRVRIRVNPRRAHAAGLTISSQLLRVAQVVGAPEP